MEANGQIADAGAEETPAKAEERTRISDAGDERDIEALRRDPHTFALIARILPHDERHLALGELRELARQKEKDPHGWNLPKHLATCNLCLELFESIEDRGVVLSNSARECFRAIWPYSRPVLELPRRSPRQRHALIAMAASLAILAAGYHLLTSGSIRTPGNVMSGTGSLAADGSAILKPGTALPAQKPVVAATDMSLTLADGSTIVLTSRSQFRIFTPWLGQSTLYLDSGEAELSVTKQKHGRSFAVQTPLGKITVIGTRFSVKTVEKSDLVYTQTATDPAIRSYREKVQSVIVSVSEGVVQVRNTTQQVRVPAGNYVVLRRDHPSLDLYPAQETPAP